MIVKTALPTSITCLPMLNCRACLWRCVEALDVPTLNARRLQQSINRHAKASQRRPLSSTHSSRRPSPPGSALRETRTAGKEPWHNSAVRTSQHDRERAALRHEPPTLERRFKRDPSMSDSDLDRRRRELRFLKDPLELANFVKDELGKDKIREMQQLVLMASQSMQCVVSFNHIIDYLLSKGRVNDGLKVYNDMKKRAQFPDSYTYTIILRGLAMNAQDSGVLAKALSVYHSLSAPNSRVEPSIIHSNAALSVCARALDMDALWGVAGKIPESGPGKANAVTYMTIMSAIRQNILINAPKGETPEEVAARKERGIMEARSMWEGIITRWRDADLKIDEELVCAMGRLLLIGARPRDWDDVLSLIEQTMDIPRMVPRLGTVEREQAGLPRLRAPDVPKEYRFDDDHLSPEGAPMRGSEFLALVPSRSGNGSSRRITYVKPGRNTLSLVMEACQKVVAQKAAEGYWDLLTDPTTYRVKPDYENLMMRLRMLRQSRSSATAVKFMQDSMISQGIKPGHGAFRVAMSTCARDKNNHNSLRHGGQILDMMRLNMEDADAKTVAMYAELATSFPLAKGVDLLNALTLLYPIVNNIRLQLTVSKRNLIPMGGPKREEHIEALRRVYGLYDKLLFSNLIEEGQKAPLKVERARLSAFLGRIAWKDGNKRIVSDKVESENEEADPHSYLKEEKEEGGYESSRSQERSGRTAMNTTRRQYDRR